MTALEDRDPGDGRSGLRERIMTTIESLKTFLTAERDRALALKNQFAIGNPPWFVAEGERQAYQAAIDELKRLEAVDSADFHQAFEAVHPGKAAEIRAAFEGAGEGGES